MFNSDKSGKIRALKQRRKSKPYRACYNDMIEKNEALKIWLSEIGDKEYSYDFTGRKIKQDDYMEKNQVGWVITYLRPLNQGGTKNSGNVIIMHHRTAEERGSAYPEFAIDNQQYLIHHDEKGDFYYIEKVISEDDDDDELFI